MMKGRYNISREVLFTLPTNHPIFIRHCSNCDTATKRLDMFLEWLKIIDAGSKVRVSDTRPYLDLKHISEPLNCTVCKRLALVQVIFDWVYPHDSTET